MFFVQTACEQIRLCAVVIDCFNDLGLSRIPCCEAMISSLIVMISMALSTQRRANHDADYLPTAHGILNA